MIENVKDHEALVDKVKVKILDEIDKGINKIHKNIKEDGGNLELDYLINSSYDLTALVALKCYINDENTFLKMDMYDTHNGLASYYVTEEDLNIMLQPGFNTVYNYFYELHNVRPKTSFNFSDYLTDKTFPTFFIKISDRILYRERFKQEVKEVK